MLPTSNKEYFYNLTSLRGIASLWVAVGHISWTLPATSLVLFFPMIRHGYLAVDFFFILSGFVLAHAYKIHTTEKLGDYLTFCRARITRIFPIHIFILIILSILSYIFLLKGITLPGVYNVKSWLAEIFLIQIIPIFDKSYFFAWNYPAWTLVLEVWWFIVIVGFISVINKYTKSVNTHLDDTQKRKLFLLVSFGIMLSLASILMFNQSSSFIDSPNFYNSIIRSGFEFIAGLFLYKAFLIKQFNLKKDHLYFIYLAIFGGISLWFFTIPSYIIVAYWLLLIPFILITSLDKKSALNHVLIHPTLIYLGNISYSLYMIHGPIERTIAGIYPRLQPSIFNILLMYFIFIGSTLLFATLSYKYIEKPFMQYFKKRKAVV
ncbi:MAG: acyltransferase [Candidatus Paceibacterota bacterium]